jgi:hypothetical protein
VRSALALKLAGNAQTAMPMVIAPGRRSVSVIKIIINADRQECHRGHLYGVHRPGKGGLREAENF